MSTIDDLIVKLGLDSGDLDKEADKAAGIFNSSFAKITAAGVGAGISLEAFARTAAESNIQTRQMAASLGISSDVMRDLALETANVGFPLDEVLDLMETGKQLGLRGADSLKEYAEFWDDVGDATGESATELGKAGVALASLGIEAGNEAQALAAFGFIQEHSTQTVGDFLGVLGRIGPDLKKMGLDVNDAAAILAVLEQEMGMTGRAARGALNEAISASDGTFSGLIDTLGITETTLSGYIEKVELSSDVIARNADIQAESFTPLQKAQHWAEELKYEYGDLASIAGSLAIPLMALGPAVEAAKWAFQTAKLVAYKVASLAVQAATKVWAGVQWLLNAAIAASGIGAIVILIGLLITAIIYIATQTTWFQDIWRVTWEFIKEAALAVGRWFMDTLWGKWIKGSFEQVVAGIGVVLDWFKGIPGKIGSAFSGLVSIITWPWRTAFNFISDAWNNTVGRLSWSVPGWVPIIGGKTISAPKLPKFHDGGMIPGHGDVPIMARGGEGVFTEDQMSAMGGGQQTIVLQGDGRRATQLLLQLFGEALKGQGLAVVVR